jgi:CO/xanthine dehydrogenase Mo-binding subunit
MSVAIKRLEDPRLLAGREGYLDDVVRAGMLHAVVVRSAYAHARLRGVDVSRAAAHPRRAHRRSGRDRSQAAAAASPDDVTLHDGAAIVRGMPDRRCTLPEIAALATEPLQAEGRHVTTRSLGSLSVHVSVVGVDTTTGEVHPRRISCSATSDARSTRRSSMASSSAA